jgi:8-oxo-dGTP pyrophosphatase MutT (NUDIX family)
MSKTKDTARLIIFRYNPISKKTEVYLQGKVNGTTEFPGGKVDTNENSLDAVVREAYEECGLRINNQKKLKSVGEITYINNFAGRSDQTKVTYFAVDVKYLDSKELNHRNSLPEDKIKSSGWVNFDFFLSKICKKVLNSQCDAMSKDEVRLYTLNDLNTLSISKNSGKINLEIICVLQDFVKKIEIEQKSKSELKISSFVEKFYPEFKQNQN